MGNALGTSLAAGIISLGALGVYVAPHAVADTCQEDQKCWSCVDDGNRVCGPGNPEGKPAGCYDDGGVLVASWPCYVVIDPVTGDSDVYSNNPRIPDDVY